MATTWTITTDTETITVDAVDASDGHPQFTVGEAAELTLLFHGTNHVSRYSSLMEYVEYMNDATINTGHDSNGVAWYRETLHPDDSHRDKLIELVPDASIPEVDSHWAVIVKGEDDSRVVGAGEKVRLTVFIISKLSKYATRSDVHNAVRAEL